MGILDRAKQGDAQAIATLINRSLALKGVTALVRSRQNRLDIVLQGETAPAKSEFLPLIAKGLQNLGIDYPVHLYARRLGEDIAAWKQVLPTKADSDVNPAKSKSGALAVNVNMSQLSNAKLRLEEFQDVVVRFSDRQGRVKCLTSLKELVQVIGRPSFAYTAIAKDANLKLLLDSLAEFSTIDRAGRQLLTQAAILSPGQNWRKVNIQIINQLTFLPGDDTPAINVNVLAEYTTPQAEAFARPAGSLLDEFGAALADNSAQTSANETPISPTPPKSEEKKSRPRAGEWLDEFGAAVEKDIEAEKPLEIYTKVTSEKEKPDPAIASRSSLEPEVVPYSAVSGSFLDEFTAAIDSNEQVVTQPPADSLAESITQSDFFSTPAQDSQDSTDLFSTVQNIMPGVSPISEALSEASNQPQNDAPEVSLSISLSDFADDFFGESLNQLPEQSIEQTEDIQEIQEIQELDLPPRPPLPQIPKTEARLNLFENLFGEDSQNSSEAIPTAQMEIIPSLTEPTPEPSGSIFDEFAEALAPAPAELPYSMDDLLAELQSNSLRQPKPTKIASN